MSTLKKIKAPPRVIEMDGETFTFERGEFFVYEELESWRPACFDCEARLAYVEPGDFDGALAELSRHADVLHAR